MIDRRQDRQNKDYFSNDASKVPKYSKLGIAAYLRSNEVSVFDSNRKTIKTGTGFDYLPLQPRPSLADWKIFSQPGILIKR